jgi:hypothetical protein
VIRMTPISGKNISDIRSKNLRIVALLFEPHFEGEDCEKFFLHLDPFGS